MPLAPLAAAASAIGTAIASIPAWVGVLINLGMTLLSYLMMKKPKPADLLQVYRGEAQPRRYVYGRRRIGGVVIFWEVYKGTYHGIQYFTEGETDLSGAEIYVDKRAFLRKADGFGDRAPYKGDKVYVDLRSGTVPGVPYGRLIQEMPNYVTADFRGDGMTTGYIMARSVKAKYTATVYPNGWPKLEIVAPFGTCLDPRTGKKVFTQNMVLHLLDYLRNPDGCNYADRYIDLSGTWARAATIADQILVTKEGKTVGRYHGGSDFTMAERRAEVIKRLVFPMDGRVFMLPSGKIGISVGAWEKPTVHIPDAEIIDAELKFGPTEPEACRDVVIKFSNALNGYTETTTHPWRIREADGQDRKEFEVAGIDNNNHARRLAKIIADKLSPTVQGWIETDFYGLKVLPQGPKKSNRFIRISYSLYDIVEHAVEVEKIAVDPAKGTVRIWVRSASEDRYDFDAATEEGDPVIVPEPVGESGPVEPSNFQVIATFGASGTTLTLSVDEPIRPGEEDKKDAKTIETEFSWAEAGTDDWVIRPQSEAFRTKFSGIPSKGPFDVRVRHIGADASASGDVIIEDVTPVAASAQPKVPTGVTVAPSNTDAGTAVITFTTPPRGADYDGIQLWRSTSSNAAGAVQVDTMYRPDTGTFSMTDTPGAGTYHYFVASVLFNGRRTSLVPAANNPVRL